MDQKQWEQINRIVDTALKLNKNQREHYISEQCKGNPRLKSQITKLLESIEKSDTEDFLEEAESYPHNLIADLANSADSPNQGSSLIGETINNYQITELIDHGGMGSVFLAKRADEAYQKKVAIKILRRGMDTPSNIARFKRERSILAKLNHPNIARLLDGGMTDEGLPYLVMEYVQGTPLYTYCDENKLSIEKRLDLFKSICQAVKYAHKNAIIHRDLKPSNILVTENGQIKILDFGIAKLLEPEDPDTKLFETQTGARILTLGYAAPEQVEHQPITTKTDIYTLGILLYELLASVHPFDMDEKNFTKIEKLIRHKLPSKPSARFQALDTDQQRRNAQLRSISVNNLIDKLQGDLDAIIMKILRKEPEARYDTVTQLLEDLNRREQNQPIIAREDSFRYKIGKFIKRHKSGLGVATGFLLLVTSFIFIYTSQIAQERNEAQLQAEKAEATTEFLVDLFSASDPTQNLGDTIRVRSILEEGLAQINELNNQPEVQSQLLHTMGKVYVNLGEYTKAERLLEQALELQKNINGKYSVETASIHNELGGLHQKAQQIQQAEPHYAKALDIRKEVLGTDHVNYAETLSDLGALMRFKGNADSAETLYNEALSIRRSNLKSNHPDIANSLNNLGVLQRTKGNLETAQKYYQEALQIRKNHFGDTHPKVANVMNNLAVLYRTMGEFDQADKYFAQTLKIRKQVYGRNHPLTAQSLNNYAGFLADRKNFDKAENYYRQALEIRKELLGSSHIQTGTAYNNLANVLFETSKLDSAEQAYQNAIDIYASSLGENHRYVGIVKSNMGKVLTAKNNLESAEKVFDEALSIMQDSYDSENISFANLYGYRAQLELKKENLSNARQLLEDALEIRKELQGSEHPEFKQNVEQLTEIYKRLGHTTQADSLSKIYLTR